MFKPSSPGSHVLDFVELCQISCLNDRGERRAASIASAEQQSTNRCGSKGHVAVDEECVFMTSKGNDEVSANFMRAFFRWKSFAHVVYASRPRGTWHTT